MLLEVTKLVIICLGLLFAINFVSDFTPCMLYLLFEFLLVSQSGRQ